MISRRAFIGSAIFVTLPWLLSGCNNSAEILKIFLLEDSIPPQSIRDFHKIITGSKNIDFQLSEGLSTNFDLLKNWQNSKNSAKKSSWFAKKLPESLNNTNLLSLGDSWLQQAIVDRLIQPLDIAKLEGWNSLPLAWQNLVRRNERGELDDSGQIWGAPYRWGSTVIAYREDKLQELNITPTDWQDLWREDLKERISLLDSSREVIGLTLKKLGYSYNQTNLATITNLETELATLHRQAKLYSSDRYLEPLILGDTWMAVAWSGDILPLMKRYSTIKFILPRSGTALWSDLWVQPTVKTKETTDNLKSLMEQWISFCWESKTAQQISLFTHGISPIIIDRDKQTLIKDLQNNVFLNSGSLISEKSEFIKPLDKATEAEYLELWKKIRTA
jgi:putative spermidine/putrescine transport system substrate-binding protein